MSLYSNALNLNLINIQLILQSKITVVLFLVGCSEDLILIFVAEKLRISPNSTLSNYRITVLLCLSINILLSIWLQISFFARIKLYILF
jgi:hypothetical protein